MGDGNDRELEDLLNDIAEDDFPYVASPQDINYTPTYSWAFPQQEVAVPEDGDIKIGERSLKEFMDKVESRLAILTPDSKKLEKFAALRKAYEHYKTLESLCELEEEEDEDEDVPF